MHVYQPTDSEVHSDSFSHHWPIQLCLVELLALYHQITKYDLLTISLYGKQKTRLIRRDENDFIFLLLLETSMVTRSMNRLLGSHAWEGCGQVCHVKFDFLYLWSMWIIQDLLVKKHFWLSRLEIFPTT